MQSRITYNCTVTKLPQAEGISESFKWLERSYHYIHQQQRETRDEQDKEAAEYRWRSPTHSNRYQVVIVTGVFPQDMTIYAKTSGRKHPNGVCFKAAVQTLRPISPTDVYFKNCGVRFKSKAGFPQPNIHLLLTQQKAYYCFSYFIIILFLWSH